MNKFILMNCVYFRNKNKEFTITKCPWSKHFQSLVCLFCSFNITGDIKNFVRILIILVLFDK